MNARLPLVCALALLTACPSEPVATPPSPAPTATPAPIPTPSATTQTVSRRACGWGGRIVSFRVLSEEPRRAPRPEFARTVRSILCDRRSWIASGNVRFRYHPRGSLLIGLRRPSSAERRCLALIGLSVNRFYSCGHPREVVINSARWLGGSPYWPGPLRDYRRMLMNHEVGHALLLHHTQCERDGARAPVMMQQSKGLRSPNGRTCARNPWPRRDELALLR